MLSQEEAKAQFLPEILSQGSNHKKFRPVSVRRSVLGEKIVTTTSDGKETENTAQEGDVVVRNSTKAGEEYIVRAATFAKRYLPVELPATGWCEAIPAGRVRALVYNGAPMEFTASWGEPMTLKTGDMIVSPLPEQDSVYRIAAAEFVETYQAE